MPRKSKKTVELPAEGETPAAGLREPDEPELKATSKTGKKVRAKATVSPRTDEALAEAVAEAADTFEQAFEDRVPLEHPEVPVALEAAEASEAGSDSHDEEALPGPRIGDLGHPNEPAAHNESGDPEPVDESPIEERPPARQERLQKILSQAGVASRRHAEEMIVAGRIEVNGKVVTELGSKADPDRDHIRVDGKLLRGAERLRYFVLNKPKGYVTTVSDPEGRPTVMDFFKKMHERLYPVGRLDYQSEGLLLVTNDGELANKLTRPASGVERVYLVKVSGQPATAAIEQLRTGLAIDRGRRGEGRVQTSPAEIREFRQGDNPWFEVVLREGRNRELRKMFEEIGHHVEKIRRVEYGPLVLDLEPGRFRELEPEEVARLRLAADGKWRKPKAKEHEGRRKEFNERRPADRRTADRGRPAQRKPEQGPVWRRDSRGSEGREQGAGNRGRPGTREQGRNALPMRNVRPPQGGGRTRPERPFGEWRERAPREEAGRGTRQQRPERPGWQERPSRPDRPARPERGGRLERAERRGRPERPGRPEGAGRSERASRPERVPFKPGRAGAQGFKKGPGRPPGSRPEGRRPEGGRPAKFGSAMGRGRPASGSAARAPQGVSNRRPSSRPGPNRDRGPRGKRG